MAFFYLIQILYTSLSRSQIGLCLIQILHDDVIKWKQFPCSSDWPIVWGVHRSPLNFPHRSQWRRALVFYLICAWKNSWANNWDAGDLRCHRTHYDVAVMICVIITIANKLIHDDVMIWKRFPQYWLFVRRPHRSPVISPTNILQCGA